MGRILHGITDTRAFLSNKTSPAKLQMMRFFGLNVYVTFLVGEFHADVTSSSVFGGPSQPEPTDHRGGIYRAHKLAEEREDTHNPNQYINDLVC